MKRAFLYIIALAPILIGCDPMGFMDATYDLPAFASLVEANNWVHETIAYETDSDIDLDPNEDWKLPDRTLADQAGDCEDMAALLGFIAIEEFGVDTARLVALRSDTTTMGHMVVEIAGIYYDPNRCFITTDLEAGYPGYSVENQWSFEEYCEIAAYSPFRSVE